MKLISKLLEILFRFSRRQTAYARAGTVGKIVRLIWMLLCIALNFACIYGAKYFFGKSGSSGDLAVSVSDIVFGFLLAIFAVGLTVTLFFIAIQHAVIGFTATGSQQQDDGGTAKPKKIDLAFGAINVLYALILPAGAALILFVL